MNNSTSPSCEIQPRRPHLLERARRMMIRKAKAEAAVTTRQFRKSEALAARREAAQKASASKDFQPAAISAAEAGPLVIATPSPSTPSPNNPLTKDQMLTLIRQVRERYKPSLAYQKRQESIRKRQEQAERRLPPTWARAGDDHRGHAYARTIIETGHAVSVRSTSARDS